MKASRLAPTPKQGAGGEETRRKGNQMLNEGEGKPPRASCAMRCLLSDRSRRGALERVQGDGSVAGDWPPEGGAAAID